LPVLQLQVISRPNPKIDLGPIDCSVALLLCDLTQPDTPIVYASDPFCELTGYSKIEVMGQNCRFLQAPPGVVVRRGYSPYQHKDALKKMRRAVEKNDELQIKVVNFKKSGERFVNFLSIIPVRWEGRKGFRYSVGLLVDVE
jgi:PAS domain S-box-containing protein